eukprot:scaffold8417_cov33-Phaeocystis_antarctica.AAC.1
MAGRVTARTGSPTLQIFCHCRRRPKARWSKRWRRSCAQTRADTTRWSGGRGSGNPVERASTLAATKAMVPRTQRHGGYSGGPVSFGFWHIITVHHQLKVAARWALLLLGRRHHGNGMASNNLGGAFKGRASFTRFTT